MEKLLLRILPLLFLLYACGPESKEAKTETMTDALDQVQLPSKADFKQDMDGKSVELFHLSSKGIRAAVTNYGGRLVSLWVEDAHGEARDVVLGFNTLEDYSNGKNGKYHGATIGRYANRIAKGKFSIDGQEYVLATNNNTNHLHGGEVGFESVVWHPEQQDDSTLKLSYMAKDGEEGYPGNLGIILWYRLRNNQLEISFEAETDKTSPVNLCNHAYFNLNGEGSGTFHKHEITIAADNYTPVDETLIPTGEIRPVEGTAFDLRKATKLEDRIDAPDEQLKIGGGYDHNFVLAMEALPEPEFMARVKGDESGIVMEMHSTEPGVQFYGGNFMDGSNIGKSGKAYNFREAFCLEPQHFPDSPNQANFPSTLLNPGEFYRTTTVYTFSVGN